MSTHPFKPFKPPNGDIPIIGQAFTLKGGFPTVLVQCGCQAKEPVMLVANQPGACKVCGRMFVCASFEFNGQTGQIHAQVGLVQRREPAPEPVGATS